MGFFNNIDNKLADVLTGKVAYDSVTDGAKRTFDWLGLAGDLAPAVGAGLSFAQQSALVEQQQKFQERMSNTAHQREVQDLLNAGINPLYTANGGSGASTPVGATGSQTDFANAFSSGVGRSLQRRMQNAQIESIEFQNAKLKQDVITGTQQALLAKKEVESFDARLGAQIGLMNAQGQAALAAGAASSANASYINQQRLYSSALTYYQDLVNKYGDNNPAVRSFGFFLQQSGLSAAFSGLGAGFGASFGSKFGTYLGDKLNPSVAPNPVGFRY